MSIYDPPLPDPAPARGPCEDFVTAEELAACEEAMSPPETEAYAHEASRVMWILLGRAVNGVCTATVEAVERCFSWSADGSRSCSGIALVHPTIDILSVREAADDEDLDPALYEVWDRFLLVRTDAIGWINPTIEYRFGTPVAQVVRDATKALGVELWRDACPGVASCLPKGTTSVSRQGVSMTVSASEDRVKEALKAGDLGQVAAVISLYNPGEERVAPEVWSPDADWQLRSRTT